MSALESVETVGIPDNWSVHSIGDVFQLVNGRAFRPDEWKQHGLPIVRIQNLNDESSPYNYYDGTLDDRHRVKPGDVLFAWSGTTGVSFGARIWSGPEAALNQHIFKVLPDRRRVTESYAYLVLRKFQQDIEKQAHGFKSSFVHVKKSDIVKVPLVLPPIKEQRVIEEVLLAVQNSISASKELIAKKRAVKHAAMVDLLGGAIRLPGFDGEWRPAEVGEVAEVDSESLGGSTAPGFSFNYISLEDVTVGRLTGSSRQRFATAPSRARRVVRDGDVLVATVRPNLKSHLLFTGQIPNAVCSTGFAVLRSKPDEAVPGFLYNLMMSSLVDHQIDRITAGSSYPAISSTDVRKLGFLCPPIGEQRAIARALIDMDNEIEALSEQLVKTQDINLGMMDELLTGRIRLSTDVRSL